jgi:hypothetical protein
MNIYQKHKLSSSLLFNDTISSAEIMMQWIEYKDYHELWIQRDLKEGITDYFMQCV